MEGHQKKDYSSSKSNYAKEKKDKSEYHLLSQANTTTQKMVKKIDFSHIMQNTKQKMQKILH